MAFFNNGAAKLARMFHVDSFYMYHLSKIPNYFPLFAPLMADKRFPVDKRKALGILGLVTMGWISSVDAALQVQKKYDGKFWDAIVTYERLIESKGDFVKNVLAACGHPVSCSDSTQDSALETVCLCYYLFH